MGTLEDHRKADEESDLRGCANYQLGDPLPREEPKFLGDEKEPQRYSCANCEPTEAGKERSSACGRRYCKNFDPLDTL